MARFGFLFLQEGNWDGEQVIPADWVAEATAPSQSLNQAYGYLWWLNEPNWLTPVVNAGGEGLFWPDTPDDAYAALGFGNQIVLVIPSLDLVITRAGPANPAALLGRGREEGAEPVPNTSVNEIGRLAAEAAAGS
jgi:CubicO group peptidase (beta-lactamase class C family)